MALDALLLMILGLRRGWHHQSRVRPPHQLSESHVDRLFDFSHHSRWDLMESALGAVGHRLEIVVQPAA